MSNHMHEDPRRHLSAGADSAAAAKQFTVVGQPVTVLLPGGRLFDTTVRVLPWASIMGRWFVGLEGHSDGFDCRCVTPRKPDYEPGWMSISRPDAAAVEAFHVAADKVMEISNVLEFMQQFAGDELQLAACKLRFAAREAQSVIDRRGEDEREQATAPASETDPGARYGQVCDGRR